MFGLSGTSATVGVAIIAALAASDQLLGIYAAGWSAVLLGAHGMTKGTSTDSFLVVDCLHTLLVLYTSGLTPLGDAGLTATATMFLHLSYHLATVTLLAMVNDRKIWRDVVFVCCTPRRARISAPAPAARPAPAPRIARPAHRALPRA